MGTLLQKGQKKRIDLIFAKGSGGCVREICVRFLFRDSRNDPSSLSFICGKKALSLAVSRNKMRRRMRECAKRKRERIVFGAEIAVIFRGKREISFQETDTCIEEVFKKTHLFI